MAAMSVKSTIEPRVEAGRGGVTTDGSIIRLQFHRSIKPHYATSVWQRGSSGVSSMNSESLPSTVDNVIIKSFFYGTQRLITVLAQVLNLKIS
jgi:hypothetical protein